MDALKVYASSITQKEEDIERSLEQGDIEAFTVMVHSLKSTSLAVGAQDISELALNLEKAGKDSDMNMIIEYLPELLKRYRSL